jgi:hypothetical protein
MANRTKTAVDPEFPVPIRGSDWRRHSAEPALVNTQVRRGGGPDIRCTESLPERATWSMAFGDHTEGSERHVFLLSALALLTPSFPIVIVPASRPIGFLRGASVAPIVPRGRKRLNHINNLLINDGYSSKLYQCQSSGQVDTFRTRVYRSKES